MNAGTIVVPTTDTARYTGFYQCLQRLRQPSGTITHWAFGSMIAMNINRSIVNMKGDWLQIWGDDHWFDADILNNLLARDVDIVVPLCTYRKAPYHYVHYKQKADGTYGTIQHDSMPDPTLCPLLEVERSGFAGAVIKRHVFEAIKAPWFEYGPPLPGRERWKITGEDVSFSDKVIAAGFKIMVDLEHPIGHMFQAAVLPKWNGREMVLDFRCGSDVEELVELPQQYFLDKGFK